MIEQILILAFIGTILSVDVTLAGQLLLSRPIVVLTLIGFVMGSPLEGFFLGVILELVCVDMLPLGIVIPLDTAIMSTVSGGVFFVGIMPTEPQLKSLALFFALLTGIVFRRYDLWFKRKTSVVFAHLQEAEAYLDSTVSWVIASNVIVTMLRNFLFLVIFIGASCFLRNAVVANAPESFMKGFALFDKFLPLFAASMALKAFQIKRIWI